MLISLSQEREWSEILLVPPAVYRKHDIIVVLVIPQLSFVLRIFFSGLISLARDKLRCEEALVYLS